MTTFWLALLGGVLGSISIMLLQSWWAGGWRARLSALGIIVVFFVVAIPLATACGVIACAIWVAACLCLVLQFLLI